MCKTPKDNKSKPFVYDYRKVAVQGFAKRCMFPQNYDEIVKHGIIEDIGVDDNGELKLALIYGEKKNGMRLKYTLFQVAKFINSDRFFYAVYHLIGNTPVEELHRTYYEPFGFTRMELEKYMPVFEIEKSEDPNNPYRLANTRLLTKKGCSLNEFGDVDDKNDINEKGRNGQLLYFAKYRKHDIIFYLIRDEHRKVEVDKSCISVPFVFAAGIVKLSVKLLIYLPMKLGSYLLKKQNPIAKIFGHVFFTPFVPIKFLSNLGAAISKMPILLFVARKEKYGDYYYTLWKHELLECFNELESDISLIKNGKRPEKWHMIDLKFGGTWKELDIYRKQANILEKRIRSENGSGHS